MDGEEESPGLNEPPAPLESPPETPAEAEASAPPSTSSRTKLIAVAVVAAVAVLGGLGWFLRDSGPALGKTYGPTNAVPFSIDYPEAWNVYDQNPGPVTISPIDNTSQPSAQVISKHPEKLIVVNLLGVDAAASYDVSFIRSGGGTLISEKQVEIGGRKARRLETTFPPSGGVPATHAVIYLVDLGLGRVLPIAFIASEEGWDEELFRAMAESVVFDDAKLKAAADAFQDLPFPVVTPTVSPDQTAPSDPSEVQVSGEARGPLRPGEEVPEFSAPGIDGGRVTWSNYVGTPTVLVVWAPWCPHCQKELPLLGSVAPDFPGVQVVTVVSSIGDSPGPDAADLLQQSNLDVPTAVDTGDETILRTLGVEGFPTTYYVKADGTVMLMTSGETTEDRMRKLFEQVQQP